MATWRIPLPRRLWSRRAVRVWWWLLISSTAINGVVVGYGALWFLQFSPPPDRSDYLVSGGGYGAAAVVLAFAAIGAAGLRGPRSAVYGSSLLAVLLGTLAIGSFTTAAGLPPDYARGDPWDGAGGVLCLPWTWPLLLAGVVGTYRRATARRGDAR